MAEEDEEEEEEYAAEGAISLAAAITGVSAAPIACVLCWERSINFTRPAGDEDEPQGPPPSAEAIVQALDRSIEWLVAAGDGVRSRAAAAVQEEGVTFLPALALSVRLRACALGGSANRLAAWAAALEEGEGPPPLAPFSHHIWRQPELEDGGPGAEDTWNEGGEAPQPHRGDPGAGAIREERAEGPTQSVAAPGSDPGASRA